MTLQLPMVAPALGLFGLLFALLIFIRILRQPAGEGKMIAIAEQIHRGAMAFMKREFKLLALFALLIGGLLALKDVFESMAFFAGAICSSFAGYVGMFTATKANVRTTAAAKNGDSGEALSTAFFGGSIMGLAVASVGLVGIWYTLPLLWRDRAGHSRYSRICHGGLPCSALFPCGWGYLHQGCRCWC